MVGKVILHAHFMLDVDSMYEQFLKNEDFTFSNRSEFKFIQSSRESKINVLSA